MKGAIFDLDGTLMDSMSSWARMWERMLGEYHIVPPERFAQDITPLGAEGTAHYLQGLGMPLSVEEIIDMFQTRIYHAYAHEIQPKPHVPEYLQTLRDRGVRICVLTASPQVISAPCLKRTGLWELLEFSCSCDEVGMPKSDPAIYPLTAERLGIPLSEVCFFDDNLEALTAGKRAGVYTVGVFDQSSAADRPRIEALTDRYITDFSQLLSDPILL